MMQPGSLGVRIAQSAVSRFNKARVAEPHPLYPTPGEILRYVREVQLADAALAHAIEALRSEPIPASETQLIERKRASADAAVARQVFLLGRRIGADRDGSIAILNAVFELGSAPLPPLDGRYIGHLITPTLFAPLDSFGRLIARMYMPWRGKRFVAENSTGDNIFEANVRWAGRLYWPAYSDYRPYRPGLVTAFRFRTYEGPGVQDSEISTLKLDYDNGSNPAFLVRSVLDELVQITGNYYLGKAFLRRAGVKYRLAAFFALQTER